MRRIFVGLPVVLLLACGGSVDEGSASSAPPPAGGGAGTAGSGAAGSGGSSFAGAGGGSIGGSGGNAAAGAAGAAAGGAGGSAGSIGGSGGSTGGSGGSTGGSGGAAPGGSGGSGGSAGAGPGGAGGGGTGGQAPCPPPCTTPGETVQCGGCDDQGCFDFFGCCMPDGTWGPIELCGGTAGAGGGGAAGAPGCEPAVPGPDPCDCLPQEPAGYFWDGATCAPLVACCPSMEQGELYPTEQQCAAAHAACTSCAPTKLGPDPCDCDPGQTIYYWDGDSCVGGLVCCPEANGPLYTSFAACASAHAACPDACPAECTNGCSHSDKKCGTGTSGEVTCLPPPPDACPSMLDPVCACDGTVYPNECVALLAGEDLSQLGNCAAPEGTFPCGEHFCDKGSEYCQRATSDIGGWADGYACVPVPPTCGAPGGGPCACFEGEPCGFLCELDAEGNVTLTCLGG